MNKRWLFIIVLLITLIPNLVSAKEIPLLHNNCHSLVNVLNKSNLYSAKLSAPEFFKYNQSTQRRVYSSVINGGNSQNGLFLFEEDSNGNLYHVICSYNINDSIVAYNATNAQIFLLNSFGVNNYEIKRLLENMKLAESSASNAVWSNSVGGYVVMIIFVDKTLGNMSVGFLALDSKN